MNIKKFIFSFITVTISFQLMDFIVINVLLKETLNSLKHLWRPDMNDYLWIMPIVSIVFSILFTYIYTQYTKNKGITEGLLYGISIGVMVLLVSTVNQFVIYPLPLILTIKLFVFGIIEFAIVGILISLIYKPKIT